ncbi:MAG TPA: hypothetical protein VFA56_14995 [Gaiellaceae bacterium]|nr:hypothetical protein [Gaiellaceae bacterium]
MSSFLARHRRGVIVAAVVTALLAGGAIAAYETLRSTGRSVTVPGDRIGCVYSSRETGHRFIRSIQPGERVTIGKTDELVQLPTNDIVYNITSRNSSPEAPGHLLAYTKGQVALFVEGVLKFRFNTTGNSACKWYSRYGMQSTYGDMGFTVAPVGGAVAESPHTGWYRFLAEAHANTMKQVVHDGSTAYTWQQLTYGADPSVQKTAAAEPVSITYGKHIGSLLAKYLTLDLGGNYFCGVQPGLTGAGSAEGCPPMYFQVISTYPRDKTLADEHEALRRLDAKLNRQKQAAKLQAQNRSVAISSAKTQRKVLEAQIVNTRLTALNDAGVQKCLILARAGLDCDGKKPQIIVAGVPNSGR